MGLDFSVAPDFATGFDALSSDPRISPISAEYIPEIEAAVRDAARDGMTAGHERVDIRVVLTGGSSHEIESSPTAFRAAASMAFTEAAQKANPVVRIGMDAFAKAAKEAGADGVLLTDMIVEEAADYLRVMHEHGLAPVFLAAPTSPDARLKAIAENSGGFVYAISRTGITGTQQELAVGAKELVQRIKQFTTLPVALGFGVSTPEHVKTVGEFADAAVIGSAIVALIEKTLAAEAPAAVGAFVASLRGGVA
nr:tryptophan synthase subunit alpha [Bryocella elongata]